MEKSYFDTLMSSLESAVAFSEGDKSRAREVHASIEDAVPEYKAADVARTRKSLNMSQRTLACALGVSTRTVEAWEAGKNTPSGAARHLLYLLDCDPTLVDRLVVR